MKRTQTYLFLALLTFLLPSLVHAGGFSAFKSHAQIEGGGRLTTFEDFVYNFGTEEHHGVVREIPTVASDGKLIEISKVLALKDNEAPFTMTKGGNIAEIRIGDPAIMVSGEQRYQLYYEERGGARKNSFTWVAFPTTRDRVDKFRAELFLPRYIKEGDIGVDCTLYFSTGATNTCPLLALKVDHSDLIKAYRIDLVDVENASVVVTLHYPNGFVETPPFWSVLTPRGLIILGTVIVSFVMTILTYVIWIFRKKIASAWKKLLKRKTKADHFSFLARAVYIRGGVDERAIVATLADLSDRGYLALDPKPLPAGLGEFIDYSITASADESPDGAEGLLFSQVGSGIPSLADWLKSGFPKIKDALNEASRTELGDHILADADREFVMLAGFRVDLI